MSEFIRVNLRLVRVDARTELVVAADIAERLGISRARVSVLVSRSDFPRSIGRLGRSDVWRWSSVERWARETGRLDQAE
jgi:predicted DNA-binding transcriptional regulator AlpA